MLNEEKIKQELTSIGDEVLAAGKLKTGDLFVLGCSSSEVIGDSIGKNSNVAVGFLIVSTIKDLLDRQGISLAVQGCEHINRALAMERAVAEAHDFEIVSVVPQLHAGGACSVAAFELFADPVEVETITAKAGIDIGDTAIGMHVRHVQVPIRPHIKQLGFAHVAALYSRPKYIGGPRASY